MSCDPRLFWNSIESGAGGRQVRSRKKPWFRERVEWVINVISRFDLEVLFIVDNSVV